LPIPTLYAVEYGYSSQIPSTVMEALKQAGVSEKALANLPALYLEWRKTAFAVEV